MQPEADHIKDLQPLRVEGKLLVHVPDAAWHHVNSIHTNLLELPGLLWRDHDLQMNAYVNKQTIDNEPSENVLRRNGCGQVQHCLQMC